ncbi:PREDICTED: uncharacterized protein LOC106340253 isoform X1 [Brassica oleracea var. oleracea]|uniref:uncharacterized protein LOC106340253 isoform X1 n=1 Tax=Brassica oleracea var. oleracea TaxID=109376 RepID=UPI0006A6EBA3|nr:PREDICTED: uncharacterized protein LOC106340253 isoform X1 [Brassica oleracea var. oleracea]
MNRSIHIRLHVGGYWAADGTYNGGETRCCRIDFEDPTLKMLESMIASGDFPENMNRFSYFRKDQSKKDVCSDTDVVEMVSAFTELESVNIFAVRADDPYLDDVLIGGDEEEEEQKSDDEWTDFYKDDYVESEDSDDDEDKKCSNCGEPNHNKRTCKQPPVNLPNPPKPSSEFPSFHANIVMTCGNCHQTGHNKRKCTLPYVPKPPNMRSGRPSKKQKTITQLGESTI